MKTLFATIIAASTSIIGCSRPPAPKPPPAPTVSISQAEPRIADSLGSLLQRGKDGGAFLIVEENRTGKFVQFGGSANEPLLLDLPIQTLSVEERSRAQQLFSKIPGSVATESGFNMELGQNAAEAATLTMRVFQEVYLFDDAAELTLQLTIE